jgi:hypothetical protein
MLVYSISMSAAEIPSHVAVKVDFNVAIDANSKITLFSTPAPVVTNIIVAQAELDVKSLYDGDTERGLIEIWEPSDAQGDIKCQLANTDTSSNGGPNLVGAYQVACKTFARGLQAVLCDAFDCSGVAPFNNGKYGGQAAYTLQRDFGRVALATFAHYLFGHVDATAAITNDIAFVQNMLSINAGGADETQTGADTRAAAWRKDISGNVETWDTSASQEDANLALRLVRSVVAKGKDASGNMVISSVQNATTDALSNIVKQVIGQDSSRTQNVDGSERTRDQHQLLRFYPNDVIYMNIVLQTPTVEVTNASTSGNPPSANLVSNKSFTLKIKLKSGDPFLYTDSTKTVISGYNGAVPASVTIPDGITGIADEAFLNATGLVSITLPAGLLTIGARAFKNCTSLTTINIPSSVTSIGEAAFEGCTSLTSALLPGQGTRSLPRLNVFGTKATPARFMRKRSVASSSTLALSATNAETQKTSESVPKLLLARRNLARMRQLSTTFSTLSTNLFKGCTSLETVAIPNTVAIVGSSAFQGCAALETLSLPGGVTSLGTSAFQGSGLTTISLPTSISTLPANVFKDCAALTSVTIPSNVTTIGSASFAGCTALTDVTINSGVEIIGQDAFKNTTNLTAVTIPPTVTTIRAAAFQGAGITSITVPSSVTTLETAVFADTPNLTSAIINANVNTLPAAIFRNAASLASVNLSSAITTIASEALRNTSITTFSSSSVQTIEANAFADIPVLTSVSLPSLQTAAADAFVNVPSLTEVPSTPPLAPTNLIATAQDGGVEISFTAGSDGGSSIINYKYSLDNGTTFIALNPVQTSSPITITGLTNGSPYSIQLRAVNGVGDGSISATVTITLPSGYEPVTTGRLINFDASSYSGTGQWINTGSLGTAYNATITTGRTATKNASGNGFVFNGTYGWTFPNIGQQTSFTIGVWVKRTGSAPTYTAIVSDGTNESSAINMAIMGPHQYIPVENKETVVGFYDTVAWRTGNKITLPTNQWVYVVGTFNNSTKALTTYLNDTIVGTITQTSTTPTTSGFVYRIGQHIANASVYYVGEIGHIHIYNRALTSTEILQNYSASYLSMFGTPVPSPAQLASMLVSYGQLINFTASSYSGTGQWQNTGALGSTFNATITAGGTAVKNAAGNGIVFNGTYGWSFPNIGQQTSFTISAWVKRTGTSPNLMAIVGDTTLGSGPVNMAILSTYSFINIGDTETAVGFYDTAGWRIGSKYTLPLNTWVFVCGTYDFSTKQLITYINGTAINMTTQLQTPGTSGLVYRIGQNILSSPSYYVGEIGQILIYERALTSTEVLQNYNVTRATFGL